MFTTERIFGMDPEFCILENTYSDFRSTIPPMALIEDHNLDYTVNDNGKKVILTGECGDLKYYFIEDGAALELNITPTNNLSLLKYATKQAFNDAFAFIDRTYNRRYILTRNTVAYYDTDRFWKQRGEDFRDCVQFGCDPDKIPPVYKEKKLINIDEDVIIDASNHPYRYFGGHLHVQNMSEDRDLYVKEFNYVCVIFDFMVGLANACLHRGDIQLKHELERLNYFGHPGRSRLQEYSSGLTGYEYRPLSNYWLSNPNYMNTIFASAIVATKLIENNYGEIFFNEFESDIPAMYKANLTLDKNVSKILLSKVYKWLILENIIDISDVPVLSNNG